MQIDRAGFDNRDAKLLVVGLSFEAGSGRQEGRPASEEERVVAPLSAVTERAAAVCPDVAAPLGCPDRDSDHIPDVVDRCPEVAGIDDNWGCPVYKKVIVRKDKLELKEKLYFGFDQARIEEASFPLLDEVVLALKDNPSFRVQIDGHSDSSGPESRNQTLSEERAAAVLNYLATHGIDRARLSSKGFSSSVPTDTNGTASGRENNRRVEFVVSFSIVEPGSAK